MASKDDGKVVAIVSYITLIGWIVALIMNHSNKTELGSFHIRQTLLLFIVAIVLGWIPIIGWLLSIVLFVFWIIGFIGAVNGEKKEMPIIGKLAQDWFKAL
jgi:uncharacterized membrane protein